MAVIPGSLGLAIQFFILSLISCWLIWNFDEIKTGDLIDIFVLVLLIFCFFSMFGGYMIIGINDSRVVSFMGKYKGTVKSNGWYFKHPFYSANQIDLAVINHNTATIEVNEKSGVPIQISAVISYKVVDTYKYSYEIISPIQYITNQFEVALREFAKGHTYQQLSELDHNFVELLNNNLQTSGVVVSDAKMIRLNYVESIAASMLQKQQAESQSSARQTIVDNALMISLEVAEKAKFANKDLKDKFVADLILVLCSHAPVTPTISIGKN